MTDKQIWFDYLKSTLQKLCPQWTPFGENYNYFYYTRQNYIHLRNLKPDGNKYPMYESEGIAYGVDVD